MRWDSGEYLQKLRPLCARADYKRSSFRSSHKDWREMPTICAENMIDDQEAISLHRARKALAAIERVLDRLEGQEKGTAFRRGDLALIRNDLERVAEYGDFATPQSKL
jgi:hypothetical protein